jgi:hypothetical protein
MCPSRPILKDEMSEIAAAPLMARLLAAGVRRSSLIVDLRSGCDPQGGAKPANRI